VYDKYGGDEHYDAKKDHASKILETLTWDRKQFITIKTMGYK
jgi:hypothetical protein